jgi:anti-repressor protein
MENGMKMFVFENSVVRVENVNNTPWFVAKDVADILGYRTASDMSRRLDADERGMRKVRTLGGEQEMVVINESGLYNAILGSSKPEAKTLKKWVTGEVLPEIRKNGGYVAVSADMTDEEIMARALQVAQRTIDRKNEIIAEQKAKIEQQAPKVAFVETFVASSCNILVRDYAKHIAQSLGIKGFGQQQMFDWLKEKGYMNQNRYPSQRSTECGYLHVTEGIHILNSGDTQTHHVTRITPKGQAKFYELISNQYNNNGKWW